MKIVNRETFLALPVGTIFQEYRSQSLGELTIKGETIRPERSAEGDAGDYYENYVTTTIKASSTEEESEKFIEAEEAGRELEMDVFCETRNGCFELGQLYAIWSHTDVLRLADQLLGYK